MLVKKTRGTNKMKKLLTLTLCILIATVTFSLVTAYTADELSNIKVFNSSNGDGFTPFDLRWNDGEFGIISFNRQKADGSIPFSVYVFLDGEMCYGSATYYDGDARVNIDIADTLRDSGNGEYIFIVYASDTNGNVRGEKSKSEPFIYSDAPERTPAPPTPERNITPMEPLTIEQIDQLISLTIEIRSEKQAIITLTDNRLPDILQKIDEDYDYFANWDIIFGTNPEYFIRTSTSILSSGGESWRDIISDFMKGSYADPIERNNAEYIHWSVPQLKSSRPHNPYLRHDLLLGIRDYSFAHTFAFEVLDNSIIFEVSIHPNENFDFAKITEYSIYSQMYIDSNFTDVNFTRTFAASYVVDMRNFGQSYDIKVPDTELYSGPEFYEVVRGMSYEQAEFLYFTLPENNYVLWRGVLKGDAIIDPFTTRKMEIDVYEIVLFDDNGIVTQIINKIDYTNDDDYDTAFNFIINARGGYYHKHKVVIIDDNSAFSYARSGVCSTKGDFFLETLEQNNGLHIDTYLEAMKDGALYFELLEVIEKRG